VTVARRIVGRGRQDAVGREPLGDGHESLSGDVLLEDAQYDGRGDGVGLELVQARAHRCLGRVWVRAGVAELVSVRRSTTEEPPLGRGLSGHGGADTNLDAVALALAHAAVEAHDEVVGVRARVDPTAYLGHPQLDAVVREHRERKPELVAVESASGFADHHGAEAAVRSPQGVEQERGLRPPLPRQRPGLADVEELGDDVPVVRLDERLRSGELPTT